MKKIKYKEIPQSCCEKFRKFSRKNKKRIDDFVICPFCGKEIIKPDDRYWWGTPKNNMFSADVPFSYISTGEIIHRILNDNSFNWDLYIEKRVIVEILSKYDYADHDYGNQAFVVAYFESEKDNTSTSSYNLISDDDFHELSQILTVILSHISSDTELYTEQLNIIKAFKKHQVYNDLKDRIKSDIDDLNVFIDDIDDFVEMTNKDFIDKFPDDIKLLLEI